LLIVFAGAFGTVSYLFLGLPSSIGILVFALIASFAVIATDALFPTLTVEEQISVQVLEFRFSEALLEGMLGLLLFAGALHVKLSDLCKAWLVIFLMATTGVGLST
jgi:CPA1 family monovalent cation:H+ antiporter